jgi:alanine racemase
MPESRSLILNRRTWAEVSLTALGENFHAIQKHIGSGVTICAVVKADGYGHGAVKCARALESESAQWLGVTDAAEGLALRGAGVQARVLLMTGIWRGEEDGIIAQNLTPTIWEPWHIELLERAARKRDSILQVHLKLDTGMNRLGAAKEALPHLCEMLSGCKHLSLEGVSTHFASAEVLDARDAVLQMQCFEQGLAVLQSYGLKPRLVHMGNLENHGAAGNRTLRILAGIHPRRSPRRS